MTEAEWLACVDPTPMLEAVRGSYRKLAGGAFEWEGGVSNRKLRLFDCACCRRVADWLNSATARKGLDVAERYAEGLLKSSTALNWSKRVSAGTNFSISLPEYAVYRALWAPTTVHPQVAKSIARLKQPNDSKASQRVEAEELAEMVCRLRCVLGNPFRPVTVDPSWLTSDVVALAEGIYQERAFDRMPILADALEDAGCDNGDILNHCRRPGEHVRGCWVVDLLLGKK